MNICSNNLEFDLDLELQKFEEHIAAHFKKLLIFQLQRYLNQFFDSMPCSIDSSSDDFFQENVYALIQADLAVKHVLTRLEDASAQLASLETWLNDYNAELNNLKASIDRIETKNNQMAYMASNQQRLKNELEKILVHIFILFEK